MSATVPKPWTLLHSDDGDAIVVPEGTSVPAAVVALISESYGGEPFSEDNPVVVAACEGVKVEVWHSCSAALIEAEGIADEGYNGWWAPFGDGKRSIHVVAVGQDAYSLGEDAEAAVTTDA